jgi:hypothetical protein
MKRLILPLLVLVILVSCKNKTSKQDKTASTPAENSAVDLIAKFKPIFTGNWVKISYIDKVISTKSPLAAYDEAQGITEISFNHHEIEGDSMLVMFGWNNHEGGEQPMRFTPGRRPNSLQIGETGEIQYTITKSDTILTLYWPLDDNKAISSITFKKAYNKGKNLDDGLNYFINKGLFTGQYILKDSTGKETEVQFYTDGTLHGFAPFKTYRVANDLNSDAMTNLDEITFNEGKKIYKSFTYKITGDTLKLFSTKANTDSSLLVVDKLRYTLIRK